MSLTARLPQALFSALETRLQLVSLATLKAGYRDLSRDYRLATVSPEQRDDIQSILPGASQGGRAPGGYTRAQARALGYLAARFPATYAAVLAALRQIPDAALKDCATVLDVGAGPGTATWALSERWPALQTARFLESNAEMLQHADALAKTFPKLKVSQHSGDLLEQLSLAPVCDLVLIAYVLNELPETAQDELLLAAWEKARHGIFLLEPGTPDSSRRMLKARTQWTALGGRLVAPCPQAGTCPLDPDQARPPQTADTAPPASRRAAETKTQWCHFSVRLERRGLHKAVKGGALGYEDEKFCWLYISKDPSQGPSAPFRLHSDPHRVNRNISLEVCDAQGTRRRLFYKRRETHAALRQAARQLFWGAAWDPASVPLTETEDEPDVD
jgi:ribosomal protein RSM22 (predicted rRNA methylase)